MSIVLVGKQRSLVCDSSSGNNYDLIIKQTRSLASFVCILPQGSHLMSNETKSQSRNFFKKKREDRKEQFFLVISNLFFSYSTILLRRKKLSFINLSKANIITFFVLFRTFLHAGNEFCEKQINYVLQSYLYSRRDRNPVAPLQELVEDTGRRLVKV